jgi:iron complex transport system ATP-binding protein
MTDRSPLLQAQGLEFAYQPDRPILRGVDFAAQPGVFTALLGPNGSGKTTLLRCLLGELAAAGGSVLLEGQPLSNYPLRERAKVLAYVPQFPESAFAFTARQIVMMGRLSHMGPLGIPAKVDEKVVELAMEMTDATEFADRTLSELSGGEAQRVMIARALAQQPAVLLLDEPTSHLDIRHQLGIYRMMERLADEWGIAVVCVSHDVNLASRFADRLVVMKAGQILAGGTPSEVLRRDVLEPAYDVTIDLIDIPGQDVPMVQAK